MSNTTIKFDGVYHRSVSATLVNYIRFFKNQIVMERAMEPVEDSKYTKWDFGFILDKGMEKMMNSPGLDMLMGGGGTLILSGTYTIDKDKSVRITLSDGFMFDNEYIGTFSKDGLEMIISPKKLMGTPITDNREMKYTFRAFKG